MLFANMASDSGDGNVKPTFPQDRLHPRVLGPSQTHFIETALLGSIWDSNFVKALHQRSLRCTLLLIAVLQSSVVPIGAQELSLQAKASLGAGWHPWYEIKTDPEESKNIIVCGTKWDAELNAALGVVYASADGGMTWQTVLEDRNSTWVTEQSCAFGAKHAAYFVSEASRVIDGEPHHQLGTTRLYMSTDGGQHWIETVKTGWADYSTSAVSSVSGKLYTFFNATTAQPGRNWGSNVGLLVFTPDGKKVAGPFFNSGMQDVGYDGVYPSNAIALRSGAVVALYWGIRVTPTGRAADFGVVRADQSHDPLLAYTMISQTPVGKDCLNFDQGSLAYDIEHDRLFVVYVDGCKDTRIMLTSSEDEGKSWAESVVVADAQHADRKIVNTSLVVRPKSVFGLLWEQGQGSGSWFFSVIRDKKLVEPPIQLSRTPGDREVSNDSLWTWIYESDGTQGGNPRAQAGATITLNVRTELNNVWRANGLAAQGDKVFAVWPSGDKDGMRLNSSMLSPTGFTSKTVTVEDANESTDPDVTQQALILYGGTQHFDNMTGTLEVCVALGNRGDTPIRAPIRLEAREIRSPLGVVSILGATNGLTGAGAQWDISDSITGNQIPPRATSNPFCLTFHVQTSPHDASSAKGDDLLILKTRVLASSDSRSRISTSETVEKVKSFKK
jgi:hypothetical protein